MRPIVALSLVLVPVSAASQAVQTRTVSRPTAEFREPFTEIASIRELSDGRLIVVDGREAYVALIDVRAGTMKRVGRTGDGPGEYRQPMDVFGIQGDTTLLRDGNTRRWMIIGQNGEPEGYVDPNANLKPDELLTPRAFGGSWADGVGGLYAQTFLTRREADGSQVPLDSAAVVRLDRRTMARDTIAVAPIKREPGTRVVGGMMVTAPRTTAFNANEHWVVSMNGRVARVFADPYRVSLFDADGRRIEGPAISYDRVKVDDALKQQYRDPFQRPSQMTVGSITTGRGTYTTGRRPFREPSSWPEFLPPFLQPAMFDLSGRLWIPRAVAAGRPPLYDVIDGNGRLVERVELPPRHKLVGFGNGTMYLVRLDEDDLQYLQRYPLPTSARP